MSIPSNSEKVPLSKALRPKVGVGIAVTKLDKVLLGKRKGSHGAGYWSFPGGHLEYGETPVECVRRELREEAGIEPQSIFSGPWTNDVIEGTKHYVTLFMFVPEFSGTVQLLEPDKCEGWEWFAWEELPSPLFLPVRTLVETFRIDQIKSITG